MDARGVLHRAMELRIVHLMKTFHGKNLREELNAGGNIMALFLTSWRASHTHNEKRFIKND
jgi:hypothetical protein